MLPSEAMYPYTAKVARERGELELWRANFRTNCACAGAIELAIRRDFDGMHLGADCAKSVIDQYGYKRVGFVLANTLQEQSYDGRYHETNKVEPDHLRSRRWRTPAYLPHKQPPAVLDGFVSEYRAELAKLHLFGAEHCEPNSGRAGLHRQGADPFAGYAAGILLAAGESAMAGPERLWLSAPRPWPLGTLHLFGETARPRGGTALSSWALSVTSVSLIGQRKNWVSCGTACMK